MKGRASSSTHKPTRPCAAARKETSLKAALAHCHRCITGSLSDYQTFCCMGKMAYLRAEYSVARDYYLRSAAISLLRWMEVDDQERLRRLSTTAAHRASDLIIATVTEHEPNLVYHLGHAAYAAGDQTGADPLHALHAKKYAQALRGLTGESAAYDPAAHIIMHYHDQGVAALRQGMKVVLAVFERYCHLLESKACKYEPGSTVAPP